MIKRLKFLLIFNTLVVIIFVAGMFTAYFHVRPAIMWYSLNKATLAHPTPVSDTTGYEVFNELNKYRTSQGLPDFILYEPLCNNIGERWTNYKETNSHAGLLEFIDKWQPGAQVAEILVQGDTAQEMVEKWTASPSHDVAIKSYAKACVYSAGGLSVGLLSN